MSDGATVPGGLISKMAAPRVHAGCWQKAQTPCRAEPSTVWLELIHKMAAGFLRASDLGENEAKLQCPL